MGYKRILVHADLSRHAPARLDMAARLAAAHGAHLLGAAFTGIARVVFPTGYNVAPASLLASYVDPLAQAARRALDRFEDVARRHGVAHEARLVCDQAPDGLALLARFADLVVLSQDDPDESLGYMPSAAHAPDYVVFNAARPVLVVPCALSPATVAPACTRRILLCWNGSREAAIVLAGALPLLCKASEVLLAVLGPLSGDTGVSETELADVLAFLRHHGVIAAPVLRDAGADTGQAILSLASEQRCDLVAMGCYGHSRLQELMLGGASRTVLREAAVPVLMAR